MVNIENSCYLSQSSTFQGEGAFSALVFNFFQSVEEKKRETGDEKNTIIMHGGRLVLFALLGGHLHQFLRVQHKTPGSLGYDRLAAVVGANSIFPEIMFWLLMPERQLHMI